MNIVLIAEESAGAQALRLLAATPHRITRVLTSSDATDDGRGRSVAALARDRDILVLPARLVKDPSFAEQLRADDVALLLNVHSLYIVHEEVLAAPSIGSFNLHPGPLPDYAGLNVPSWAIYEGQTRHAVSLHRMAPSIDAGPVASAAEFEITSTDTGLTLTAKCVRHGVPLLAALVEQAARDADAIPARAQDLSRRRYYSREVPNNGMVPWWLSAQRVVDFVRACDYGPWPSPWGTPQILSEGRRVGLIKATTTATTTAEQPGTVGPRVDEGVLVAACDEWVLVRRLRVDGRAANPAAVLTPGQILAASAPNREGSSGRFPADTP